jgi:hypothetical protein
MQKVNGFQKLEEVKKLLLQIREEFFFEKMGQQQ